MYFIYLKKIVHIRFHFLGFFIAPLSTLSRMYLEKNLSHNNIPQSSRNKEINRIANYKCHDNCIRSTAIDT